ncbi:hypothetical protein [Pseudomonas syringae]|uniref:hypothetical protein n=1 Tax=Pseudomonas syringae TaxID=317 RepID=UPI001BCDFFFA|nr:hypothetical protein [Pseudomonas syringae]QVK34064.1 hypothetical protein KIJ28_09075 [Pseudomonas syringae]
MKVVFLLLRVFLYLVYFACLFMYVLFQGSEYDWMEPSLLEPLPNNVPFKPIESESNNRAVFRGLLVALVFIVQAVIFLALSRKEAITTIVLLGMTLLFCI